MKDQPFVSIMYPLFCQHDGTNDSLTSRTSKNRCPEDQNCSPEAPKSVPKGSKSLKMVPRCTIAKKTALPQCLRGLFGPQNGFWAAPGRPRAAQKTPRGPKTPPQRVPKRAQERPKRVPSTIFECLNSFEMRLTRKCKNHEKCCKVLQNARFGGARSH